MKRLYIAAALLLVIVAVAYIKSARGTSQRREAFEQGKAQTNRQLTQLQQDVDSLKELLRLQEAGFSDSLAHRDGLYRQEIGRLVGYLDSAVARPRAKPETQTDKPPAKKPTSKPEPAQVVQQVAQEESEKPKTETKQAAPQAAPQNDKSEPDQASHKTEKDENDLGLREDVLTFYGQLYEDLPKDLTSQERKVALYEISIKTAAEYSITMPQLKAICEDYYLSY